jgi:hypothetical protein
MAVIAFGAVSCEDTYSPDNNIESAATRKASVAGNYVVEASSSDGYNFTLSIDQSGAQDISHLIVQLVDCNGEYVTIDSYTSSTVNGMAWPLSSTTGGGTDCTYENAFVKFDDFNFDGGIVVVEFSLDVMAAGGYFLIKAGQGCYEYEIDGFCADCVIEPVSFDIFAGQTMLAGQLVVTNDDENLYVTYMALAGESFEETHLYVGTLAGMPVNKQKTPVIGHFPYSTNHEPAVTEVTYTIPLNNLPDCYIIAAHSAMTNGETAWSYGTQFPGTKRWGWYSEYCTQYCESYSK